MALKSNYTFILHLQGFTEVELRSLCVRIKKFHPNQFEFKLVKDPRGEDFHLEFDYETSSDNRNRARATTKN